MEDQTSLLEPYKRLPGGNRYYIRKEDRIVEGVPNKTVRGMAYCHSENKMKPAKGFSFFRISSKRFVIRAVCDDCIDKGLTLDQVYPATPDEEDEPIDPSQVAIF